MSLILDRRATMPGPGLHALLVGVSEYPFLPASNDPGVAQSWFFKQLASPALSALRICEWLQNPATELKQPLKTVRLLLAPSAAELAVAPELAGLGSPATRDRFQQEIRAWRADAADQADNVTFFYFGGHGLRRGPGDSILTFADFCDPQWPKLTRCARVANIHGGMAPSTSFPNIATTQFYFIDACRETPQGIEQIHDPAVPDVFDVELNTLDRRSAPIFFATIDGARAAAQAGRSTLFTEALLHAFARGSEQPIQRNGIDVWPVTTSSLKTAIERYIALRRLAQDLTLDGHGGEPPLLYLPQAPLVEFEVEVLPPVTGPGQFGLYDDNNQAHFQQTPVPPSPIALEQPAGNYRVTVDSSLLVQPYRSNLAFVTQRFNSPWRHNLSGTFRS